jgi:hypothetical protein
MIAYTDYPIAQLGDEPGRLAPMRECMVISYDYDKYCKIRVLGVITEIKAGYIYKTSGRFGKAEPINPNKLPRTRKK